MAKRPKSALPGGKRAVTDFAKLAAYHNGNIRYKASKQCECDGGVNTVILMQKYFRASG